MCGKKKQIKPIYVCIIDKFLFYYPCFSLIYFLSLTTHVCKNTHLKTLILFNFICLSNIVKKYVKRLKWKNIFKNSCIIAYCPKKKKICFGPVVTSSIVCDAKSVNSAKKCLPKGVTYGFLTETGSWLIFALPSPHTLNFVATV